MDRMPLPDPPRAPRGLPQRMKGVAGLIEVKRREREEIEACLHQLRVTDHYFHAFLQLLLVVAREEDALNTWMQFSWLHAHTRPDLDIPGINTWKTRPKSVTPKQWDDLAILLDDIQSGNSIKGEIKVVTHARWADIVAEVNNGIEGKPYDVLVVDYIQHLETLKQPPHDEIKAIFKAGQALSRDYHGGRGLVVISPLQSNKTSMDKARVRTGASIQRWERSSSTPTPRGKWT